MGLIGCGALRGLWALYACSVRRLRTEKRKTCNFIGFIGFIGLLRSCCCFSWFVLWLLLRSCCLFALVGLWVVVFFPSDDCGKKKGRTVLARPLFVPGLLYLVAALYSANSAGLSPLTS